MSEEKPSRSIFLYDIAGAIIGTLCISSFVSITWNASVLFVFLLIAKSLRVVGLGRFLLGVAVASIGGALIDWFAYMVPTSAYTSNIRNEFLTNFYATNPVRTPMPRIPYPPFVGLYFMPLTILCIGLFNLLLGKFLFKLNWQKSAMLGITMGFLTAPWLVYLPFYSQY